MGDNDGGGQGLAGADERGSWARVAAWVLLILPLSLFLLSAVPALQLVNTQIVVLASLIPHVWAISLGVVLALLWWRPRPWSALLVALALAVAGVWVTRP